MVLNIDISMIVVYYKTKEIHPSQINLYLVFGLYVLIR